MTFGARAMAPPGDCGKPDMAIAQADNAAARYGGGVGKIALQDPFYAAIMFVARPDINLTLTQRKDSGHLLGVGFRSQPFWYIANLATPN